MLDHEEPLISVSDEDLDLWCKLPVCGCGNPDVLLAVYHSVLRTVPKGGADDWLTADQRREQASLNMQMACDKHGLNVGADGEIDQVLYDVVLNVLDHMRCTEHGGSIGYCWLEPKGQRLLAMLDQLEATSYDGHIVGPIIEHSNGTASYQAKA